MAPSANSALSSIVLDPIYVPPNSATTLEPGLSCDSYSRESSPSLKAPLQSDKANPKSWWRAQCRLYGVHVGKGASILDMRDALEKATDRGRALSVPEEVIEVEQKEGEKSWNARSVREKGEVGSESAKGKVKGKKTSEKDRDVLKVVKSGPKVGKKTVKKVVTKPIGASKAVKIPRKKTTAKADVEPPTETVEPEPYEGEPMMWPMELDIDEDHY